MSSAERLLKNQNALVGMGKFGIVKKMGCFREVALEYINYPLLSHSFLILPSMSPPPAPASGVHPIFFIILSPKLRRRKGSE